MELSFVILPDQTSMLAPIQAQLMNVSNNLVPVNNINKHPSTFRRSIKEEKIVPDVNTTEFITENDRYVFLDDQIEIESEADEGDDCSLDGNLPLDVKLEVEGSDSDNSDAEATGTNEGQSQYNLDNSQAEKKQFSCNICQKVFARKAYLRIHSHIHTGVDQHQCQECKMIFGQPGSLKRHVCNGKLNESQVYKKAFETSPDLAVHNRVQTEEVMVADQPVTKQRKTNKARVSKDQYQILLNFMQRNPFLVNGLPPHGVVDEDCYRKQKWAEVIAMLHATGPSNKSVAEWKQFWAAKVWMARKTAQLYRDSLAESSKTGYTFRKVRSLTNEERVVLSLVGKDPVTRNGSVPVFDAHTPVATSSHRAMEQQEVEIDGSVSDDTTSSSMSSILINSVGTISDTLLPVGLSAETASSSTSVPKECQPVQIMPQGGAQQGPQYFGKRKKQRWSSVPLTTVDEVVKNQRLCSDNINELANIQSKFYADCLEKLEKFTDAMNENTAALLRQTEAIERNTSAITDHPGSVVPASKEQREKQSAAVNQHMEMQSNCMMEITGTLKRFVDTFVSK